MAQRNLMVDLKGILQSEFVSGISKQLNVYEKKVKELVKDLNLRSVEAREKSRQQLDLFAEQIKKTRDEVEKKVVTVVNLETQRLNKGVTDLVSYLKTVAKHEKTAAKTVSKKSTKAKAPTKSTNKSGAKAKGRKSRAVGTRGNNASDHSSQLSH